MVLKIFLTESDTRIEAKILRAISEEANLSFPKKANLITNIFSRSVYDAILGCPEMASVSSGLLKIDFGLNFDPVAAIANAVAQSIIIKFKPFNIKLTSGGYNIRVQPLDYLNLLSLPEAVVITEKGVSLPWLDWLLTYGDSIIIADFGVKYSTGKGRAGGGYMLPTERPFSVNAAYSGTVDDNFITRAIMNQIPSIEQDLIKALK